MKQIIFENWIKFDKKQWLCDMRRALNDIEKEDGENVYDILEDYYEENYINFAEAFEEGRLRREKEILIMMDECEKEGWDFNRFINTFSKIINKNEKNMEYDKK
jgi:hypothetical protein